MEIPSRCPFVGKCKWELVVESANNNYAILPRPSAPETDWKKAYELAVEIYANEFGCDCKDCIVPDCEKHPKRTCRGLILDAILKKCTKGGEE